MCRTSLFPELLWFWTAVRVGSRRPPRTTTPFFSFRNVQPGIVYHVTIHADGFADWTSPAIRVAPGQFVELGSIRLTITVAATTVTVAPPPEEIATQEVHIEEKQRAFGFNPAFYAVYDPHPVPLTPKLKFSLAYRTATDPMTLMASAFIAGIDQASDTPDYVGVTTPNVQNRTLTVCRPPANLAESTVTSTLKYPVYKCSFTA